jgi:hypothetical protein
MRKIREVLRLHFECDRNQREIAEAVGTSTIGGTFTIRLKKANSNVSRINDLLPDPRALTGFAYRHLLH